MRIVSAVAALALLTLSIPGPVMTGLLGIGLASLGVGMLYGDR